MRFALPLCAFFLVASMSGAMGLAVQVVETLACADEGCESEGCTDRECDECSVACACSCCPQRLAALQRASVAGRSERMPPERFAPPEEPLSALAGTDIFQPPRA